MPPRHAAQAPPAHAMRSAGGTGFSSLERHLIKITSQIEVAAA
jgi:hypothetical protein